MTLTKQDVIARYAVPPARLLLGGAIGMLLYPLLAWGLFEALAGTWEAISGRPVSPPQISFMSRYDGPTQNGYMLFVFVSCIAIGLLSLIPIGRYGAGVGHALVGVTMLGEDGAPAQFRLLCWKVAMNVSYFLVLALPGPIIGFLLGSSFDVLSLIALGAGLASLVYVSFSKDKSGRLLAYVYAEIVPVRAEQAEAFRADLQALA